MDENAIRQWLIDCFGPIQGEMAWNQLSNMPEAVRDQLMSQDPSTLPKPEEVKSMMQAFTAGGLNTMGDMQQAVEQGPINIKLAKSLALQQANGAGSDSSVNAETGEIARRAISEANLWLDTACEFNPAQGETQLLTRAGWVEDTIDAWAQFASPVAESMNDALASILSQRFGDGEIQTEISGVFAGPIEIPIPDEMKNPAKLMRFVGNTSFAMQLGRAAGDLSHEVRGSFDQGIALLKNPAGGLIVQNVTEYAKSLDIDVNEVMGYLALQELAHARLFASVPWLMPRFEALLGKYARGITIDMDAMEEQIREAESIDPDSMASAVNITKVAFPDTPEQKQAMKALENLLALVEGWVDAVVWRAGMAHIPHIEQLREMLRRERAIGGPAERTFESLMGMQLRPKRMRERPHCGKASARRKAPRRATRNGRIRIYCRNCRTNSPRIAPTKRTAPHPPLPVRNRPRRNRIFRTASIGMPNCPSCSTRKSTRAMTPMARTTPTVQMTPAIRTLPATRSHRKKRDFLRPRSNPSSSRRAHRTRRVCLRHA